MFPSIAMAEVVFGSKEGKVAIVAAFGLELGL